MSKLLHQDIQKFFKRFEKPSLRGGLKKADAAISSGVFGIHPPTPMTEDLVWDCHVGQKPASQ